MELLPAIQVCDHPENLDRSSVFEGIAHHPGPWTFETGILDKELEVYVFDFDTGDHVPGGVYINRTNGKVKVMPADKSIMAVRVKVFLR